MSMTEDEWARERNKLIEQLNSIAIEVQLREEMNRFNEALAVEHAKAESAYARGQLRHAPYRKVFARYQKEMAGRVAAEEDLSIELKRSHMLRTALEWAECLLDSLHDLDFVGDPKDSEGEYQANIEPIRLALDADARLFS
jgi:hypothetical protein